MATEGMIALYSTTLAATAANVVIGGIPSSYKDLRFVVNASTLAEGNFQLQFNGDGGSNYTTVNMRAYSTGTAASSQGTTTAIVSNYSTGLTAGERGFNVYDIFDYAMTDRNKIVLARANHSSEIDVLASRWANNAAITSITILANTATSFAVGSTFTLYGIVG
jgi:hypothetical protein